MEGNKEEAIRDMEIAVKRLHERDYAGAKQIALKVERLFPQLDNISQLLAVCEVHSSAQLMANGLRDWYKIIQVDPLSDDIQIRRQYRKLALVLHPDKNKFPGAEAAFKLVGEANNTLSDRAKRVVYDLKRRHLVWSADSAENAQTNGAKNSASNLNRAKRQKSRQQPQPQTQGFAFWTSCPYCSTNHQYYQEILSRTVCCTRCFKQFQANAVPHLNPGHMSGVLKRPQQFPGQQPQMSGSYGSFMKPEKNLNPKPTMSNSSGLNTVTGQKKTVSSDTNKPTADPFPNQYSNRSSQPNFNSDVNPSRGDNHTHGRGHAVSNSMPLRSHNKPNVKSNGTAADGLSPAKKARFEVNGKQDGNDGMDASNTSSKASTTVEKEVKERYREKRKEQPEPSVSARDHTNGGAHVVLNSRCLRTFQQNKPDARSNGATPDVLSPASKARVKEKGAQDGKSRIDASNTYTKVSTTVKREGKEQNREKGNEQVGSIGSVRDKNFTSGTVNIGTCPDSCPKTTTGTPLALERKFSQRSAAAENLYEYPDAEFHNFDRCRTSNNFHRGQIWALYSDLDTYPKYYGWIRKVEHEPFKVHVSWLEACPWLDVERGWLDADLPISCGNFKVTNEKMIYDKSDYFSHMVTVCGSSKYYEILPKVGEIWAIYKDWSAGWTLHDLETCDFDIVQIRKQRKESIEVLPMKKVPQYKSVFMLEQVDGSGPNTWEVPACMFSHRIPAICLTEEHGGKLRGFWELDPASVPYAFFNLNK